MTAGGAADGADTLRIDAQLGSLAAQPAHSGVGKLDLPREGMSGGEWVGDAGADHVTLGHVGRVAPELVAGTAAPPATVNVDHSSTGSTRALPGQEQVELPVLTVLGGVGDVWAQLDGLGQLERRLGGAAVGS